MFQATVRESVDLITGCSRLDFLCAALPRYATPWIGHVTVKVVRMEAVNDFPSPCAKAYDLLALPKPQPIRSVDQEIVDLVRSNGRDRLYTTVSNSVASLSNKVAYQKHRTLVVQA